MNSKRKLAGIINRRKSSKAFAKKAVSKQILVNCVEAARWAPSSSNNQPWRFIMVDKKSPVRAKIEATLSRGNMWAVDAPLLVVTVASESDDPSYEGSDYFGYDTGMATMSFLLQATQEGLQSHQIGGYDHAVLKKVLKLPKSAMPFAIIALGYKGKVSDLDEYTQKKERGIKRSRKPMKEIAFKDKYGKAL